MRSFKVKVCCWGLVCPQTTWINRLSYPESKLWYTCGWLSCICLSCVMLKSTYGLKKIEMEQLGLESSNERLIYYQPHPCTFKTHQSLFEALLGQILAAGGQIASDKKAIQLSRVIYLPTAAALFSSHAHSSHFSLRWPINMLQPAFYSPTKLHHWSSHVSPELCK